MLLLFVHGYFSGSSVGPNRLFCDTARLARDYDIASMRYDWRGMGNSTGHISENDLQTVLGDLGFVIGLARRKFPDCPLVLVAHSVGCAVALSCFGNRTFSSPTALVLLSPGPFGIERMRFLCPGLLKSSRFVVRKGLTLNRLLLLDIARGPAYTNIEKTTAPTLIIYCLDDKLCDRVRLEKFTSKHVNVVKFASGGHNFSAIEPMAQIPKLIVRFLRRYVHGG